MQPAISVPWDAVTGDTIVCVGHAMHPQHEKSVTPALRLRSSGNARSDFEQPARERLSLPAGCVSKINIFVNVNLHYKI